VGGMSKIGGAIGGVQGTPLTGGRMWEDVGGGCGGGRGGMMIKINGALVRRLVNLGPGQGAPSLQGNQGAPRELAVKAAWMVGEGGGEPGHSIKVVGQQSQSISSSICLNVRPLCSANAVYTLEGIVVGEPPRAFHCSIQQSSAFAMVAFVAIPFLRYR
jgi:hypothetical protein